jgi:hypothetical protein
VTYCGQTNCSEYGVWDIPKERPQITMGYRKLTTYLDSKDLREMQIEVRDLLRKLNEADQNKLKKNLNDEMKKELANIKKLDGKNDGLNQLNKTALNSLRVKLMAIDRTVNPRKTTGPAPTVEPLGLEFSENPYDEIYY